MFEFMQGLPDTLLALLHSACAAASTAKYELLLQLLAAVVLHTLLC